MKASEYIQLYCDNHGGDGKDWKEVVSRIAPDDLFNFNTIPFSYRPFDMKFIAYTGRIGIIGAPRWAIAKQFLLLEDSQWRYGTERLLWVYEDKPTEQLEYECYLTFENMRQCQFDTQWLCDFNMFRVAAATKSITNRKIVADDLFGNNEARRIEDYDPYYKPDGLQMQGSEWMNLLEQVGYIEIPEFSGI